MLDYFRKYHRCICHAQACLLRTDQSYILFFGHKLMWLKGYSSVSLGLTPTLHALRHEMKPMPLFLLNSSLKRWRHLSTSETDGHGVCIYAHVHTQEKKTKTPEAWQLSLGCPCSLPQAGIPSLSTTWASPCRVPPARPVAGLAVKGWDPGEAGGRTGEGASLAQNTHQR